MNMKKQFEPVSEAWINRIFEKLTLAYGKRFIGQWDGIPLNDVKKDWAHELSGYSDKPECIKHALTHLPPDSPPNVMQFRALCQKAPPPVFQALPSPKARPEVIQKALAGLSFDFRRKPKKVGA